MGLGDEILVTGIVRKAALKHPGKKIAVGDGTRTVWSEVFEGNPYITKEIEPGCLWVHNSPGHRSYIKRIHDWGYEFNESYRVEPGDLYLNAPRQINAPYVYIEPNVKGEFIFTKDWGFDNWQRVVRLLPDVRWVQGRGKRLEGVEQLETNSFMDACGLLLHADLYVGTDGGLHHAAAALGKRAVVVWGGFVSPKIMGYDTHANLHAGVKSCGRFRDCDHCVKALKSITVDKVAEAICSQLTI